MAATHTCPVKLGCLLDQPLELCLVPGLGDVLVDSALVDGVDYRIDVCVACEQHAHRIGVIGHDHLEKLHATDVRHFLVRDDDLDGMLSQHADCFRRNGGDMDVEVTAEGRAKRRQIVFLVVEVENVNHVGKEIKKVEPRPGVDSISSVAPWSSKMPLTMLSPKPVPSPTSLVVKNGSKIWAFTSSVIPTPLS